MGGQVLVKGLPGWDEDGWDNPKVIVLMKGSLNPTYLSSHRLRPAGLES